MSRRTSSFLALTLTVFALVAAACAEATGPQPQAPSHFTTQTCDTNSNNTCHT